MNEKLRIIRELENHLELIKGFFDGHMTLEQCQPDDVYNSVEQALNLVEVLEETFGKEVNDLDSSEVGKLHGYGFDPEVE